MLMAIIRLTAGMRGPRISRGTRFAPARLATLLHREILYGSEPEPVGEHAEAGSAGSAGSGRSKPAEERRGPSWSEPRKGSGTESARRGGTESESQPQ